MLSYGLKLTLLSTIFSLFGSLEGRASATDPFQSLDVVLRIVLATILGTLLETILGTSDFRYN